jgi:hypothetical protein
MSDVLPATPPDPTPLPTGLSVEATAELAGANADRWPLLDELQLDPERPPKAGYQRIAARWLNPADPDATPMQFTGGTKLGYQDHCLRDIPIGLTG